VIYIALGLVMGITYLQGGMFLTYALASLVLPISAYLLGRQVERNKKCGARGRNSIERGATQTGYSNVSQEVETLTQQREND